MEHEGLGTSGQLSALTYTFLTGCHEDWKVSVCTGPVPGTSQVSRNEAVILAVIIGGDSYDKSEKNHHLALEQDLVMFSACLMTPALLHRSHHPTEQVQAVAFREASGWGPLQYICLGDLPQRTELTSALLNACELTLDDGAGHSAQLSSLQSASQG